MVLFVDNDVERETWYKGKENDLSFRPTESEMQQERFGRFLQLGH